MELVGAGLKGAGCGFQLVAFPRRAAWEGEFGGGVGRDGGLIQQRTVGVAFP